MASTRAAPDAAMASQNREQLLMLPKSPPSAVQVYEQWERRGVVFDFVQAHGVVQVCRFNSRRKFSFGISGVSYPAKCGGVAVYGRFYGRFLFLLKSLGQVRYECVCFDTHEAIDVLGFRKYRYEYG